MSLLSDYMEQMVERFPSKEVWDATPIVSNARQDRYLIMARLAYPHIAFVVSDARPMSYLLQAVLFCGHESHHIGSDGWSFTHDQMIEILNTAVRVAKLQAFQ